MFESYDYVPGSNIPCDISSSHNTIKKPLEMYNSKDEFIGYSWKYGDSIFLEFSTTGEVQYNEEGLWEDAETYLKGKQMCLEIYDFRHILVYKEVTPASTIAKFLIESSSYNKLVKGVYSFRLILIDTVEGVDYTLMPQEDDKCFFYIN